MARVGNRKAVLMSIHPRFANLIMAGKKRVEFRKSSFSKPVRYVLVYSTSPVQQIVGYFTIKGLEKRSLRSLWSRHGGAGGVTRNEFLEYYKGNKSGVAIEIGEAVSFDKPIDLSTLGPGFKAPQSFSYIDEDQATQLLS